MVSGIQKLEKMLLVSVPSDLLDDDVIRMRRDILRAIREFDSEVVVLDFHLVDICDSFFGRFIYSTSKTVELMGARIIIAGLQDQAHTIVFPALKGEGLQSTIQQTLSSLPALKEENKEQQNFKNWNLVKDYHFGGYAKYKMELVAFINQFKADFKIPLDPIYTGKMAYGIFDLIAKNYFKPGSSIVLIHTGGLQGIAGFNERYGKILAV